jgi:hypothetical protein
MVADRGSFEAKSAGDGTRNGTSWRPDPIAGLSPGLTTSRPRDERTDGTSATPALASAKKRSNDPKRDGWTYSRRKGSHPTPNRCIEVRRMAHAIMKARLRSIHHWEGDGWVWRLGDPCFASASSAKARQRMARYRMISRVSGLMADSARRSHEAAQTR